MLRGHPMHAIMSDLPVALIPTALLATIAARSGKRGAGFASDASTGLALANGGCSWPRGSAATSSTRSSGAFDRPRRSS